MAIDPLIRSAAVRLLRTTRLSHDRIARQVGCAQSTVCAIAHAVCPQRAAADRRRPHAATIRCIDVFRAHPTWSTHRVATACGVSDNAAYVIYRRYIALTLTRSKRPSRRRRQGQRRGPTARIAAVIRWARSHPTWTYQAVGDRYGISQHCVYEALQRWSDWTV